MTKNWGLSAVLFAAPICTPKTQRKESHAANTFIQKCNKINIQSLMGHCKVTIITNMGPHPKPNQMGEGLKRGAECR